MPDLPKRYYAIEEMNHPEDTSGVSHWIISDSMCGALRVMADFDLGDAKRLDVVELDEDQAGQVSVHDGDNANRHPLTQGPMGAHYSQEF